MVQEITKEFIDDIFNVPRDGSNIKNEDDSDEVFESHVSVSFETKVQELNDNLKEINKVKIMSKKDLFDDLDFEKKPSKKLEETKKVEEEPKVLETKPVEKIEVKQEIEKPKENTEIKKSVSSETTNSNELSSINNIQWCLTSPGHKYDNIYAEKRDLLKNSLLKGGEIPFNQYYKELEDANIDTNVPTYDTEEVGVRISEVQRWRDRIKHIQLHTNSQYFIWKEFLELLPGMLARVEYERGKQEGLFFEHFKDMVSYWGHLQGLQKSCEIVSKHLDGAYAALSRQVAIAQPLNEVERSHGRNPQLGSYDSLTQKNRLASVPKNEANAKPRTREWGE